MNSLESQSPDLPFDVERFAETFKDFLMHVEGTPKRAETEVYPSDSVRRPTDEMIGLAVKTLLDNPLQTAAILNACSGVLHETHPMPVRREAVIDLVVGTLVRIIDGLVQKAAAATHEDYEVAVARLQEQLQQDMATGRFFKKSV